MLIVEGGSLRFDEVQVTLTKEMIGDTIRIPTKGSALWKAVEDAKAELIKHDNKQ